jgi:uncharacterized protein (DUF1800 family)
MKTPRLACFAFALALVGAGLVPAQTIANLSTRAQVGTGGDILITGFNIGTGTAKTVLIRATGPALAGFGVEGTLADPKLELFSGPTKISENDNWSTPVGTAAPVTAATFSSVGAFGLTAGSRDAALLATLAPGTYTAQVSGVGGGTGVALIEVYEVGATGARLTNISTRAVVGTGGNILIPGLVISGPAGSGTRRLLVRAAGPALTALGVGGALANPTLTVLNSANATVATNDNWGTPTGSGAATAAALGDAFGQAGAFLFTAGSADAALLADFAPGSYTIQVAGVGNTSGVALVEVYDLSPSGPPVVTLSATKATANETGTLAGEFTVARTGDTFQPLVVSYGVAGSATNGIDYPPLVGFVTIPAGATSVKIPLAPLADSTVEPGESVTVTLAAGSGYTLGASVSGTVSIADNPGTLYVATLRPASNAAGSAASGLATIVLSANGTVATVNVSFSNLSSGQTGAHLFLGNSTSAGDYLLNLPIGQVSGAQWDIVPTATATSAQIIDALRNGLIYVGLDTANYPAGELRGAFLSAVGSQTFAAPPAPPAVSLTALTATDAARLLTQATFGPKKSEIDALTGGSVNAWIDAQLAAPRSVHHTATLAERDTAVALGEFSTANNPFNFAHRQRAWFQIALTGADQLRQRVAFALSQILVVSDAPFGQALTDDVAHYNDILAEHAFGNYRTLLERVTLSPVMGLYLSHLRNAKADPVAGTNPDENYAREVMQLFSIGLVQLQPDGTLKLDEQGLPIPTYNQTTISQMARIFTGWGFFSSVANATNSTSQFRRGSQDYITPMMLYAVAHEPGTKDLSPVLAEVIPANLGGTEDLKRALDALHNHANTPAFISRQLIQRLVTDNPSPAYVWRVAEKFRNNGSGVRGDLGAVVRAILTDYEARSPAVADDPGYGKLREPLLRYTGFLRGFSAASSSGRNVQDNVQNSLKQAALRAPSVFNFFEPGYVQPGPLAAAGLVAPEFQITDDTTAISVPNLFRTAVFAAATGNNAAKVLVPDYTAELALVNDVPALLDRLALVMAHGQLGTATRTRITAALAALSTNTTALERVQTAVLLVATSPEGSTQR